MAPLVQLRPSVRSGQTHAPREREAGRVLCRCERKPTGPSTWCPLWTNLSSKRRAGGETLAEPGDAGVHLALVVLKPDFCVLDRAGTRAALSETDEMDELEERAPDR
jgi:hypothetical protein